MTLSIARLFHYAECVILFNIMLNVIMLSIVIESAIVLNVVMLNVTAPSAESQFNMTVCHLCCKITIIRCHRCLKY